MTNEGGYEMFCHSTTTASRGAVLLAALLCSPSLAGIAAAQDNANTSLGTGALPNNTGRLNTAIGFETLFNNTEGEQNTATGAGALRGNTEGEQNTATGATALFNNTAGIQNTATGVAALSSNTTGNQNTAIGFQALADNSTSDANTATGAFALFSNTAGVGNTASGSGALRDNTSGGFNTAGGSGALLSNTSGNFNTAIGFQADVAAGNLTNATAIGRGAVVDASNKIRLGNTTVTVIEGQVAFTSVSDKTTKENFRPVDGEAVLRKIRGLELSSWNFIGHDPHAFRHYGPMAQDFFAAFGHDGVGQIGSETTINAGDLAGILMSAVQALEQRTAELHQKEAQIAVLEAKVEALQATHAYFVETVAARLEALEWRTNPALQITAEQSRGSKRGDVIP
jgi:trimeric autotransporter adhesin